jgi:hypothetical protein
MDRFAVYRDIRPGYVLFDRLSETVVGLFQDSREAERAAWDLNHRPASEQAYARLGPTAGVDPTGAMSSAQPRYVVRPGFRNFERVVVDQWTEKIVWGPRLDMRAAERKAARLNSTPATSRRPTTGDETDDGRWW